MYDWDKAHMNKRKPVTKPTLQERIKQNTLKLNKTIKLPGFIIVYGILAAILIAIAVRNHNSISGIDFMGTRLQIVSAEGRVITLLDPNGEFMIMESLGSSESIVHYQGATFSLKRGTSDSLGLHFTFSDGETVIAPIFRSGQYPLPPLLADQTERQQAEGDLLRAVSRLYRGFVPLSTIRFYTIAGLVMLFAGLFVVYHCLLHFPEKPPAEWSAWCNDMGTNSCIGWAYFDIVGICESALYVILCTS